MTVHLNARPMDPLDPGVQIILRFRDISLIGRIRTWVWLTQRHGTLRERPIGRVFGSCSDTDPFISETGCDSAGDHCFERGATRLVAHSMQEIAARTHL